MHRFLDGVLKWHYIRSIRNQSERIERQEMSFPIPLGIECLLLEEPNR
jgi:hypothetical protein